MLAYVFHTDDYLTIENLQRNLLKIKDLYRNTPILFITVFISFYVLITSLSIPGAIVLTLLAGSIFDIILGTFLVTLSASLGGLVSFNLSRYFFRESVMYRFQNQYSYIDKHLKKNGISFLFMIRLFPASPFGIVNLILGLTSIDSRRFFWITALAMIPGNLIYVYAGRRIGEIQEIKEILSLPVILLLVIIACLPIIMKKFFYYLSRLKQI